MLSKKILNEIKPLTHSLVLFRAAAEWLPPRVCWPSGSRLKTCCMSAPGPREYGRNILYLKWPYFQAIASHETRLCCVCLETCHRRQRAGRTGPGTMPLDGSTCPLIYISNAENVEAFHPNLRFFLAPYEIFCSSDVAKACSQGIDAIIPGTICSDRSGRSQSHQHSLAAWTGYQLFFFIPSLLHSFRTSFLPFSFLKSIFEKKTCWNKGFSEFLHIHFYTSILSCFPVR